MGCEKGLPQLFVGRSRRDVGGFLVVIVIIIVDLENQSTLLALVDFDVLILRHVDKVPMADEATLCCTDQPPGAVSPSQRNLREANVLRPAKLEHAVQRGGSNGHLGRLPASSP